MTEATGGWTTIESDPGVFTEMMAMMGVKGAQVEELYSLDAESFAALNSPVYGLIFLFKWAPDAGSSSTSTTTTSSQPLVPPPQNVFFANQVINNACATQAILACLMNLNTSSCPIDIGSDLKELREFTKEFPPEVKGLAIANCERIRAAHNSFARPDHLMELDEKRRKHDNDDDSDVYHFITYVPVDGVVYEMDGLRHGPVALGPVQQAAADWVSVATPAIQARMERYARNEIRFSLLAVVRNRKQMIEEELCKQQPPVTEQEKARLQAALAQEEERIKSWKVENIRRKHNYIPFIANLLRLLAEEGKLEPLLDKAKQHAKQHQQQQQQKQAPTPMQLS